MKLIIGFLIWIVTFSFLCIPLGILTFFKIIVVTLNTGRFGRRGSSDEEEEWLPLSCNDCLLTPDTTWNKSIINFAIVLKLKTSPVNKGHFSVEKLRQNFSSCFLQEDIEGGKYDKLSSYVDVRGGHVFCVHRKFIDLKEHIFEVRLDERGQTLEELLGEWMLLGYREKKPCWEMIMITHSGSEEGIYVAFKAHHSMIDGYSMLHILDKLTGNQSPYLVRDYDEGIITKVKQMIECPAHFGLMSPLPPEKNVLRVIPSKKYEWMVSFTSFPLDEIKAIRRKHGVHMVAVIFAIVVASLRRFVEEEMEKNVPDGITICTTLPWPRHPARDDKVPNRDKLCNHWVTAVGKASLNERDPIALLSQIEKELETFQNLGLHKFMKRVLQPIFGVMPCSIVDLMSSKDFGVGVGLTSLIGGDNYSILGCPVERIHPILAVPDSNPFVPLSCFTFSHDGRMEMTLAGHPSVFKDQKTLDKITHEYCHTEFDTLVNCS